MHPKPATATPLTWPQRWLRLQLRLDRALTRHPRSIGSYPLRHEAVWGWTVRPADGWRSHRWAPPLHHTRAIRAHDKPAARDWALDAMGID
ncbi:hypothetical protein IU501_34610 [Nocardia otitidiscaviarum]|uniref:hypothetical protein n=1 Tax=Nocardia otitidiscaviarum TaxID=1823 RepID=UPI0018938A14|nr:hypothetical protein [Nocardia otitidiscaviarum]MBF6138103.1 hypothetical protein [Nocardia otitidiscaviarum]